MPRTIRPLLFLFLFLLPLLLCVTACNGEKKSVQQTLERIMASEITLPAEIEEICGGGGVHASRQRQDGGEAAVFCRFPAMQHLPDIEVRAVRRDYEKG